MINVASQIYMHIGIHVCMYVCTHVYMVCTCALCVWLLGIHAQLHYWLG